MLHIINMGYNYMHPDGWCIDRPYGLRCFMLVYVRNAFHYRKDGQTLYQPDPAFLLYPPEMSQYFCNHDIAYADDWLHFDALPAAPGELGVGKRLIITDSDIQKEKAMKKAREESIKKGALRADAPAPLLGPAPTEDLDAFFHRIELPYNTPIAIANPLELSSQFRDISMEFRNAGRHHAEILDLQLRAFFYRLSDIYHEENTAPEQLNRYRHDFNRIRTRIYQGDRSVRSASVNTLAESMGLSVSYFQHIYKSLFGVPVSKDMIEARIEYAAYLLQNSTDPVADIAAHCGYDNPEHFIRQFRSIKGLTPLQFRKMPARVLPEEG